MKALFEQISKQQNQELLMRIERLETQLNSTLELIDERMIDQLDKDDRDLVYQNRVSRQLEDIEFSVMETDKRLDIIDSENMFLYYEEKLRDVSFQVELLINQTESNDVADPIYDKSRWLEDRIMQNTKMINENRVDIYSTAQNQSELNNRISFIEKFSDEGIELLAESFSQINDLNATMIELLASLTIEIEETTDKINQIAKFNKKSLESQIQSQRSYFETFEAKASESLTKLTDQLLALNDSIVDNVGDQSSTRKEDKPKLSLNNHQTWLSLKKVKNCSI